MLWLKIHTSCLLYCTRSPASPLQPTVQLAIRRSQYPHTCIDHSNMFHKCIIRSCSIVSESSLRLNARRLSTLDEILRIRNISTITPAVEKELELYSKKKQTSVSLRSLMDTGRGENSHIPTPNACTTSDKVLMQVACFLHRELPIRLAHRATRLEASPLFAMSGKGIVALDSFTS